MSCSSHCARRLSRRAVLAAALAATLPRAHADAPPADVAAALPQARLVGRATLRFLGLRVYDARLWAPPGFDAARWDAAPFALELQYARALAGRRIAERSVDEMRRAGPLDDAQAAAWLAAMTRAFPDVVDGDRLVGLHAPGAATRFVHNGRPTASVEGADFARRFFGIWLGTATSEPALREQLLGIAPR